MLFPVADMQCLLVVELAKLEVTSLFLLIVSVVQIIRKIIKKRMALPLGSA